MGCRIQNIAPPCGYRVDGIESIQLLDYEDFKGVRFGHDGLYNSCFVTGVFHSGNFVEVDTPDTAKYSSTLQNGIYTHAIETFIGDFTAEIEAALHLASKKRYIAVFKTKSGRNFIIGYEAGAKISYANQTVEGIGALVTITALSIYPLFEATMRPWLLKEGAWDLSGGWYDTDLWTFKY